MSPVEWLLNRRFESLTHREWDWVFTFSDDVNLTVACLWRLLENHHIRLTSDDDGQWFGLPAPVDAAVEVRRRLSTAQVESVHLRSDTLDLTLRFATGHILEVVADSSGYEAWQLHHQSAQFIAIGGGELAFIDKPA